METYTKIWIIRDIAKRAGFTIKDVKLIWQTFEDIVKEIIVERNSLSMDGLFSMYVKEIQPFEGYNAVKREKMMIPKTYKVVFTSSRTLLDLLRENKYKTKNNLKATSDIDIDEVDLEEEYDEE